MAREAEKTMGYYASVTLGGAMWHESLMVERLAWGSGDGARCHVARGTLT